MSDKIPTRSLTIQDPDNWEAEAREFAAQLVAAGERPWFEVRYPAPARLTEAEQAEWLDRQESLEGKGTYDAIELVDGQFVSLPPYAELAKAGA